MQAAIFEVWPAAAEWVIGSDAAGGPHRCSFPRRATVRSNEKREITSMFAEQMESTLRPLNRLATARSSYADIVFK